MATVECCLYRFVAFTSAVFRFGVGPRLVCSAASSAEMYSCYSSGFQLSHNRRDATEIIKRRDHQAPFTEIPLAGGAIPLLGHYPILRKHQGVQHLELIRRWFDELGPIFRVKLPCKRQLANDFFCCIMVVFCSSQYGFRLQAISR